MAFGAPRKPRKGEVPVQVIEETDSAVLYKATTMAYPGYHPQRYRNPLLPQMEDEDGGTASVENNVDRGVESHGRYEASHPDAQDSQLLDYAHTTDYVEEVLPEYDTPEDKYEPINVRVVDDLPNEMTRIVIGSFIVVAGAGLVPVRVAGQDSRRRRILIGTVGTVTGTPMLLTDVNTNPAYGFPLPSASAQAMEVRGDQELWVSGVTAADTFTVAVMAERVTNADPHHSD